MVYTKGQKWVIYISSIRPDWNSQGSRTMPGKPPLAYLQERHRTSPYHPKPADWIDHPYRGLLADGTPFWIAEPYGVDSEDEEDFAYLRENGFTVEVNPVGIPPRWGKRVTVVLITRKS